jgi:Cu/Ag efflux protein CusF
VTKQLIPFVAGAVLALGAGSAGAQVSKTLMGDTTTVTATVQSIEKMSRQVTLKNDDGTYEVLTVPESVKRFDGLKVGDKVRAHYYENVVFRLKQPGEKDTDTSTASVTPAPAGDKPKGTIASQRQITATITAIDPAVPSISFDGPNGWRYSTKVQDKNALSQVKVGDKVEVTWTAAALVSFEEAK